MYQSNGETVLLRIVKSRDRFKFLVYIKLETVLHKILDTHRTKSMSIDFVKIFITCFVSPQV